jgi:tetratricopeptide (TPR) repeat protein
MLDRHGNRIDRRNPQDIFVPLYNKQIPPGAGQVVHFGLEVPETQNGPITLEAKVNYRKFDRKYMDYVFGKGQGPVLSVVEMAKDLVELAMEGGPAPINPPSPIKDEWQRWNDYGIGLLLEGGTKGGQKGELKQAEEVFRKVAALDRADGWVNLARVYQREGRIPDALAALEKAASHKQPAAPWVINWLTGQVNSANGHLEDAIINYESVVNTRIPDRKFDFGLDFLVLDELGKSLYSWARLKPVNSPERKELLKKTITAYHRTLAIDSEDFDAHYGLGVAFGDPAWGSRTIDKAPARAGTEPSVVNTDDLVNLGRSIADRKRATADRRTRAMTLAGEVVRYMEGPRPRFESRLEPLHDLAELLGPVWEQESDPDTQAAIGRALEVTHKALHERLKPDESAEGRAFAAARKKDPAANMNAQSIVIHPLHRPGAPGIDSPAAATAATRTRAIPTPVHAQESGE